MIENRDYEERLKQYREVEIAALLHDIGKFQQHTTDAKIGKHTKLSAQFIESINLPKGFDKKRVAELARAHHEKDSKVFGDTFVKLADRTTAEMEREYDEEKDPQRNLISVFSLYTIDPKENFPLKPADNLLSPSKRKELCYYSLPLTTAEEVIYPQEACKNKDLFHEQSMKTWKAFLEEMKKIPENLTYDAWITTVEALLKKYTFNVISAGFYTKPTISLYNHLVVTAAIARSLAEFEGEKQTSSETKDQEYKHLIVKGDINGIQKFIFKIKNPHLARKATSKRLRGRSFVIQLLSYATLKYLLDTLNLSNTSIFIDAGGNFEIIAPNTEKNKKLLEEALIRINEELFVKFNGDLRVTLAYKEVKTSELKKYDEIEQQISNMIQENKYKPFHELLIEGEGSWNQNALGKFFEPEKIKSSYSKCPVCGAPKPKSENICGECKQHENIGNAITKSTGILVIKKEDKLKDFLEKNRNYQEKYSLLGYVFYFINEKHLENIANQQSLKENRHSSATYLSFSPNNFFNEKILEKNIGLTFKFLGISLPKLDDNILSFDILAKLSIDHEALGIFKADIDNLGLILMKGKVGETKSKSLALMRELSTRLDLFFSGYISTLSSKPLFSIYDGHCEKHAKYFRKIEINQKSFYRIDLVTEELPEAMSLNEQEILQQISQCDKCNQHKKTTAIYSIFAGGDDIALAGPWDMMIIFAKVFNQELKKYTGHNPLFTISAGIGLFEEKYPIGDAIKEAEDLLHKSKSLIKHNEIPIKNSITLFDDTVLWELDKKTYPYLKDKLSYGDFYDLLEKALILESWVRYKTVNGQKPLSRSFIYTLYQLWEKYVGTLPATKLPLKRTEEIGYYPIVAYHVARRYHKKEQEETKSIVFNTISQAMPWMKIVSSWILYRTKKKNEE